MFSDLKNIDVNLTNTSDENTEVWFSKLVAIYQQYDEVRGVNIYKYEHMFFPHSAKDGDEVIFRLLDTPYYGNVHYGYELSNEYGATTTSG